jgi:hypothetical protein
MIPAKGLFVLGWGLANLGVAGLVGEQLDWGRPLTLPEPVKTAQAASVAGPAILSDFALPKLDKHFKQMLERPLTVPTRRPAPPPPPPPPPPKPTMQKGQFQLIGTISLPSAGYALLRENSGGRLRQVELGQTINGLRLDKLTDTSAELTQYDDREVLYLKVLPSSKAAPLAARAAKPGAVPAVAPRQFLGDRARPVPQAPAEAGAGDGQDQAQPSQAMRPTGAVEAVALPPAAPPALIGVGPN